VSTIALTAGAIFSKDARFVGRLSAGSVTAAASFDLMVVVAVTVFDGFCQKRPSAMVSRSRENGVRPLAALDVDYTQISFSAHSLVLACWELTRVKPLADRTDSVYGSRLFTHCQDYPFFFILHFVAL